MHRRICHHSAENRRKFRLARRLVSTIGSYLLAYLLISLCLNGKSCRLPWRWLLQQSEAITVRMRNELEAIIVSCLRRPLKCGPHARETPANYYRCVVLLRPLDTIDRPSPDACAENWIVFTAAQLQDERTASSALAEIPRVVVRSLQKTLCLLTPQKSAEVTSNKLILHAMCLHYELNFHLDFFCLILNALE